MNEKVVLDANILEVVFFLMGVGGAILGFVFGWAWKTQKGDKSR